jgi:hypothetical protein
MFILPCPGLRQQVVDGGEHAIGAIEVDPVPAVLDHPLFRVRGNARQRFFPGTPRRKPAQ